MADEGDNTNPKTSDEEELHAVGALAIHHADLESMEADEHLVTVIKKHPIGLVAIYLELAVGVIAVLAMVYLVIFNLFNDGTATSKGLAVASTLFIVALLAIFMFSAIYVYRKSQLLVTNKGVVQIIQYAPFNRKISRLSMANVEDVNVEQRGVLASMLDYGTLTIQTAGQEDNFVFGMCPKPDHYANQIIETRQQYVRTYGETHHSD